MLPLRINPILQRSEEIIERDFRLLQEATQRGTLDRPMSRHRDFDQLVGQLVLESDMASSLADDGESQPF
jgi:hypothetical protein